MSIASKYNKPRFNFIGNDNFEFKKAMDLYNENPNKIYKLRAFYTSDNGKYGLHGNIVTEDEYISCSKIVAEQLETMKEDIEVIEACNNGKLGFKLVKQHSRKFDTDYCVLELIDL